MEAFDTVLVLFILLMVIGPFIFIIYVLISNLFLYLAENAVKRKVTLTTTKRFYTLFKGTPLLKYEKRWLSLIETFKLINICDDIDLSLKKDIRDQYRKRGVNPGAIRGEHIDKKKKRNKKSRIDDK